MTGGTVTGVSLIAGGTALALVGARQIVSNVGAPESHTEPGHDYRHDPVAGIILGGVAIAFGAWSTVRGMRALAQRNTYERT